MSKKSSLGLLSMLTAMAAISSENLYKQQLDKIQSEPKSEPERKPIQRKSIEEIINSRLREWNIDGKIVYAATKKAALKKASRM
jgi:hypothetical protein